MARMAAQLAGRFQDTTWKPIPSKTAPAQVDIGDLHLTAGQFLRLMAEAVAAPSLETKLNAKTT